MIRKPKLLYFVTEDWYFCSHRLPLALAAYEAGYEVLVATRVNQHGDLIRSHGLELIPIELSRRSRNPLKELSVIWQTLRIYRQHKPDIVHHVALKPILYGAIAAKLTGVPNVINALAGLGYLFISKRLQARVLRPLVETAFQLLLNRARSRTIFQNPDDLRLLIGRGVLTKERAVLIRGSGVDTKLYKYTPDPNTGTLLVVLAARMLWDKGVREFVEAARILKSQGIQARFALVGEGDIDNPASISPTQLTSWHDEKIIEWWGQHEDMPQVFAQAHIVCLPSYREGLPKVLIEAAACGRPIVATDVPGCREIVRHNENGLLIPAKDPQALAVALNRLLNDAELRESMGKRGRAMVEAEFSTEYVVEQTLQLYKELLER